jgi:hypothetical protein
LKGAGEPKARSRFFCAGAASHKRCTLVYVGVYSCSLAVSRFFERKRQWRQGQQVDQNPMFATHPEYILGLDAAEISDVAAAVGFSIGVDDFHDRRAGKIIRTIAAVRPK